MGLVNSKELFLDALKNKYAIGAFNFVNMELLQAILEGAKEQNSPVIIQSSTGAIKYAGAENLKGLVQSAVQNIGIPVIWNLDHGKTFEDCVNAINMGCTNVMIDASHLPFEENVLLTKKVVEYAHKFDVTVEGELGVLAGVEEDISSEHTTYTDPKQAVDFIEKTGVDSLAIAIGTSHGIYKFKGDAKLRIDILAKLQELKPNYPFVLHGASSIPENYVNLANQYGATLENARGVPEDILYTACQMNICKVNVDSDLRIGFTAGIREYLANNPSDMDIRNFLKNGKKYVKELVTHKISNVFNSSNKA